MAHITKRIAFLVVSMSLSTTGTNAQVGSEEALIKKYKEVVSKDFADSKMAVPLFLAGYKLADTWDPAMSRLLESGDRCFGLAPTRSTPDSIPSISFQEEASAGFLLRLRAVFDGSAKVSNGIIVTVAFDDVVQEVATEGDLRRAFRPDACALLEPVIDGKPYKEGQVAPVVIGRLYRGRRTIRIAYTDAAQAQAELARIGALATGASVAVEISAGLSRELVIRDREPISLAFAPAFVPIRTSGAPQGQSKNERSRYAWVPFTPDKNPSQQGALQDLASAVYSGWRWQ